MQLPDRDACEAKLVRRAEVRQHEHPDGMALGDPARASDATLPPKAAHTGAGAHSALRKRPSRRAVDSAPRVGGLDLDHASFAEVAVVAFAHYGDDDVLHADARVGRQRDRDRAIVDPPNRHRRRQVDGRLEQAPLADLMRCRQLAGAVQHRHAGSER